MPQQLNRGFTVTLQIDAMRTLILTLLVLALPTPTAVAQTCDTFSGLPVPRFVSLKHARTYGRVGPSLGHPVQWTYQRQGLPMEIIQESPDWRRVRDPDGEVVWMHRRTLSGRRSVWAIEATTLRARPDPDAASIAEVEPRAVMWMERCRAGWCRFATDTTRGWAPASAFWGIYSDEAQRPGALEGEQAPCYRSASEPVPMAAEANSAQPAD